MRRYHLNLGPPLALALLLSAGSALAASQNLTDLPSGTYRLDKKHASITAEVTHMGVSLYRMRFNSFDASFTYDKAHPAAARVEASVDPGSLDVGADYSGRFAQDFLQAAKFPKASFASTAITPCAGNSGTMTGNLTLMGVTKPVTFDVTFLGAGKELLPPFAPTSGFTARGKFKRSDFGSTYLSNIAGDEVTLEIDGEFDKR